MSRASNQVDEEIIGALQAKIALWQKEVDAIEVMRSRQDRKVQRHTRLLEFIAAANTAIDETVARLAGEGQ